MSEGLQRYLLVKQLGTGAFGEVYQATDNDLKREVALKRSFPQPGEDPREQAQRFKTEAEMLSRLRHPNICTLYDYFVHSDGSTYLVMEYIPGESLDDVRERRGSIPDTELRPLMMQLLDALGYLHAHKPPITHRDLKPDNVRLMPDDRIKLVDFGTARAKLKGMQDTTCIGTPGFVAPEQRIRLSQPASDIYSWACTYLCLLTGLPPTESHPPYTDRLLAQQLQDAALRSLLVTCTALAPEARPSVTRVLETLGARPQEARANTAAASPRPTSGCPFCGSSRPEIFGCCAGCDSSANLDGHPAALWVARGEDLARRNRFREAAAHFDRAVQMGWQNADAAVSLARCLTLSGRPVDALEVLAGRGDAPEVQFERARAINGDGRRAEALSLLSGIQSCDASLLHIALDGGPDALQKTQALKQRHPAEVTVVALESRLLHRQGQTADALGLLEQALTRSPGDPLLLRETMRLSHSAGRLDDCVLAIHRLQQQFPDDPDAMLTLARVHARKGKVAEARDNYLAYLSMRATDHRARVELAKLLDTAGFPKEAIVQYDRLYKIPSYRDQVEPLLGLALQRTREHGKALPFLERAVERASSASLCAQYALALLETGQVDKATKWAEHSLAMDKTCELAREILRKLRPRTT